MLPTVIFRNPKVALLWAALICWGATEFASSFKSEDSPVPRPAAASARANTPTVPDPIPAVNEPDSFMPKPGQFSPLEEPPPM